ncbi:MAG: hypothetical protein SGI91_01030 [Alphaproteobacteria bacterium]|jgi:predicted small secreted protein|nr:hypothetical protein [Alphaproteobacteria bacterium]
MTFRHACSVVAAVVASFVLTACFTVSKNAPKGAGPINDERLIGAWRGVDSDSGEEADDAFLHFQKPKDDGPLRLVWVEDKGYQVYELQTMKIGGKDVFAAKILTPMEKTDGEIPDGYFLGFYEVKGNEVVFEMLDATKIGKLIEKGVVKGIKPPRTYDMATLTGSPNELARFLASPEAYAARVDEPARIRRIAPGKK